MNKICVFCGLHPHSKNKEHIIPQWLIKMTGEPNRQANFGHDSRHYKKTGESKIRKFSFSHFQFPACEKCNLEFSALEARVKKYFILLFEKDYFNSIEIDDLLDWFDKVRIGLWLGYIMMDEVMEDVSPKFHIKTRIGAKDRCLFIYELENSNEKGIQFIGANSPGFLFTPSCFTLRVNNLYFFSYSFDFLFSKNIGFPHARKMSSSDREDRMYFFDIEKGNEKISLPLINFKFLLASTYIYQPIIPYILSDAPEDSIDHYYSGYVKSNLLGNSDKKGSIFYFDRSLHKLDADEEIQLVSGTQSLNLDSFPNQIAK